MTTRGPKSLNYQLLGKRSKRSEMCTLVSKSWPGSVSCVDDQVGGYGGVLVVDDNLVVVELGAHLSKR